MKSFTLRKISFKIRNRYFNIFLFLLFKEKNLFKKKRRKFFFFCLLIEPFLLIIPFFRSFFVFFLSIFYISNISLTIQFYCLFIHLQLLFLLFYLNNYITYLFIPDKLFNNIMLFLLLHLLFQDNCQSWIPFKFFYFQFN